MKFSNNSSDKAENKRSKEWQWAEDGSHDISTGQL